MVPQADDQQVSRHLEAYVLWLFGWVLFTTSHGNSVDARLIAYARAIADGEPHQVSWGSAVLAATYRALCDACTRVKPNSILTGCPLLLQLWSFERLSVGRPVLDDVGPYGPEMYPGGEVDRPTMGSMWCRRRVSFITVNYFFLIDDRHCKQLVFLAGTVRARAGHAGVPPLRGAVGPPRRLRRALGALRSGGSAGPCS